MDELQIVKKNFPPKSVGAWRSAALLTLLRGYKAMPGYIAASRPKVIMQARRKNRWLAAYFAGIFTIRWPVRSGSTKLEKLQNFHYYNSTDTASNAKVI